MGSETLSIRGDLNPSCQVMFFSATYTQEMFDKARYTDVLIKMIYIV